MSTSLHLYMSLCPSWAQIFYHDLVFLLLSGSFPCLAFSIFLSNFSKGLSSWPNVSNFVITWFQHTDFTARHVAYTCRIYLLLMISWGFTFPFDGKGSISILSKNIIRISISFSFKLTPTIQWFYDIIVFIIFILSHIDSQFFVIHSLYSEI